MLFLLFLTNIISYHQGKTAQISDLTIKNIMSETKEKNENLNRLEQELSKHRDIIAEMEEYKSTKTTKEAELINLNNSIQNKKSEILILNFNITDKETELEKLKNAIQTAGEQPKTSSAGHFTVGIDLPVGSYNVSGSSNFVVYSNGGFLKVNTILGNSPQVMAIMFVHSQMETL